METTIDLFENYELQPKELAELCNRWNADELTYSECEKFKSECEELGYTFDFGLDASPYNLRKIKATDFHEIAELENLQYIETTSQITGYPANIKPALIGFDTFDHAKDVAQMYGLSIQFFEKKDGWQLWYRTGNKAYRAFENGSDDYGDNYSEYDGGSIDEETFLENEVLDRLSDFTSFEELENFILLKNELFEEIEKAQPDQKVITYMGNFYETISAESMHFSHDTRNYAIGLIDTER